jgi:hypothetical protein
LVVGVFAVDETASVVVRVEQVLYELVVAEDGAIALVVANTR